MRWNILQAQTGRERVLPPLVWQTYDVDFEAAKFDEAGKKIKNQMMTVKHNGLLICTDHIKVSTAPPPQLASILKLPSAARSNSRIMAIQSITKTSGPCGSNRSWSEILERSR